IVYQLKESCGSVEGDLLSGEIHHNECLKAPVPKEPADVESTPQTHESSIEQPTAIDNINVEIQEEELSEEIVEEDEASVTDPTTEEHIL
ncbi:hypothetical protein, partial [Salmonella sp. ZJHZ19_0057]|uniref:hypothetical protein n=1 Tax=Salmonella sp. ZJHZ19_0057 TaxID=3159585 RepID=UPI00397D87EC